MSYNVLADELAHSHRAELYRRTPATHLEWGRRWGMIRAEIRGLQPDLVCLQEVDHWQQVERDMQQLGYQGCYAQRSGGRSDGCATFWRSTSFDSLALDTLHFADYDMRDNVGLLALLALKAASPPLPVAVANTHILFNPKRGDMKLGQLRLLLLRLQELLARALPTEQAAGAATLVMGDMNHQPATPVYQFMRHGWVDCLAQHRKAMAGGLEARAAYGARSSSAPPPPRLPFHQQFQQQLWHLGSSQQQWQQHQQQQQWGWQQPGQQQGYSWGSPPPPPPPQWQQQPGQRQQGQRQQPRVLQHSASAPSLLTMRRLKNAGWSAEELITATGGAHGTHLLHFLEQHHKQQGSSSHSAPAGVRMGAADDADIDMDAAGDSSDQQHPQQAQTHSSAADGGHSSSSGKQARKQQQQLGHDQDEQQPQQVRLVAGSSQQQQQPVVAAAAGEAAAAAERRHKQAWSVLDKAQRHATKQLTQAGATQQQLAELTAAQQVERALLKKQHKRERKQLQLQLQKQQDQQQQQEDQPGGGVSGVTGAVAAAAAGVGRVPPGAPLAAPAASSAAGSQQGQRQRLPLPPFFSWGQELWDEPLPASAGDGVARHGLELRSAYAELTGSEPAFTSCHDSFFGTVDYVWYSPAALQPVAVLLPPCPETHLPHHARCMPNAAIPSDHVSLVCDFAFEGV